MRCSLSYTYRFERNHTFDTKPSPDPTVPVFDITVNIAQADAGCRVGHA